MFDTQYNAVWFSRILSLSSIYAILPRKRSNHLSLGYVTAQIDCTPYADTIFLPPSTLRKLGRRDSVLISLSIDHRLPSSLLSWKTKILIAISGTLSAAENDVGSGFAKRVEAKNRSAKLSNESHSAQSRGR